MKKITNLLCMVSFISLILGPLQATKVRASVQMPPFALENVLTGNIVDSRTFKDKILLVTFFATWCPTCLHEIPLFIKLQKELATTGFSVIGLSVDQQNPAIIARFIKQKLINYPVLLAKFGTTMDFGGVYSIPVTFLVNRAGNVVKKYKGYTPYSIFAKDIQTLLVE